MIWKKFIYIEVLKIKQVLSTYFFVIVTYGITTSCCLVMHCFVCAGLFLHLLPTLLLCGGYRLSIYCGRVKLLASVVILGHSVEA